jgi:hypothetical protein
MEKFGIKKKTKNLSTQNTLPGCFAWVWNLVWDQGSWILIESVWEQGAENNI